MNSTNIDGYAKIVIAVRKKNPELTHDQIIEVMKAAALDQIATQLSALDDVANRLNDLHDDSHEITNALVHSDKYPIGLHLSGGLSSDGND